jgi:signal transduction histidine kinase
MLPPPLPDAPSLSVRLVGRPLPDGTVLVIGRNVDSLVNLEDAVWWAIKLGVLPCVLLSLLAGTFVAHRTQLQVKKVHLTAERIMRGHLRERLPTSGGGGDFDQLAGSVNHMLDEIGRLIEEVKSTSDNIAHDLRTPLTRVRTRLERARDSAATLEELRDMVDRSLADLDQTLRIITALLRIGEIEGGQRRAAFRPLDLATLVEEMGELYSPVAEEKKIGFEVTTQASPPVIGDRDLLCESLANLIDNAIKFSPKGGTVRVTLSVESGSPIIRIADMGPGIPAAERDAVTRRFYRSDKSRHVEGYGLGLSVVEAVTTLHGFRMTIRDGHPGCVVELSCGPFPNS